jgi:hypothetical protein
MVTGESCGQVLPAKDPLTHKQTAARSRLSAKRLRMLVATQSVGCSGCEAPILFGYSSDFQSGTISEEVHYTKLMD